MRYVLSTALLATAICLAGCKHDDAPAASSDMNRTSTSAQQTWDQSAQSASGTVQATNTDLTSQANQMLDQSMTYIKENKYDMADQTITKLEQWKPQLPTSYAPRIDQARSMLDAARSASNNMGIRP